MDSLKDLSKGSYMLHAKLVTWS